MNSIVKGVKDGVTPFLQENSLYKPLVKTSATGDTYPMVVIEKSSDREVESDNTRFNVLSQIEIELNIYAKDMTIENKKVSAKSVAEEIEENIKRYMGGVLHVKRTYDSPTPNIDLTISRITMRYIVKLNERRNYIL